MSITRKEFIKGIIASTVVASAAGATAKVGIDKNRYRFIYNGYEVIGGESIGLIDISRLMEYDDMVRHVAMELYRIKRPLNVANEQHLLGNYYAHDVIVYVDGKPLEIYSIGCDDAVYEYSNDDSELLYQIKHDVGDARMAIRERFGA